jgi:predicted  nucleic acid-binding Zn-ribbon protein
MIPRRNNRYAAQTGGPGSDTDALQTDVMRFMSILGLCLMALFALVQSIPLQKTTERTRLEPEAEKLQQAVAVQQQRAERLQADLNRLTAQLQETIGDNSRARATLASTQQELARLAAQTEQARNDRDQLTNELNMLKRQLAQGRDELAGIQLAAGQKAQSLRELQQRLDETQQRFDDIARRTAALQVAQARSHATPAANKPAPPARKVEKRGFTLRFASIGALERLVATGTVSLYAMAGKQAWRLSLATGRPLFTPETFPTWFHEMAASTVPADYVRSLKKSLGEAAPSSLVWGVQLPAATRQGISSLTRDHQGGDLVIGADGRLTLEPG